MRVGYSVDLSCSMMERAARSGVDSEWKATRFGSSRTSGGIGSGCVVEMLADSNSMIGAAIGDKLMKSRTKMKVELRSRRKMCGGDGCCC